MINRLHIPSSRRESISFSLQQGTRALRLTALICSIFIITSCTHLKEHDHIPADGKATPGAQGRGQIHYMDFPLAKDPKTPYRLTGEQLRYQQYILPRAYPNTVMDPQLRLNAFKKMKEMKPYKSGPGAQPTPGGPRPDGRPGETDMAGCAWVSRGPTNINGRITSIAIDPNNNQRIFATSVGGLWRSLNGARRWERVSNDFLSTVFASIAVNPGDGNEVVAGGGDPNYHNAYGENGLGIWRSTTGGAVASWTKISPAELDNQVIYKLKYDPTAPHNVYAATSRGVYLGTRDLAGNITFARLGGFDAWTNDIAVDFGVTPRLVYAGVRDASVPYAKGIWKFDGTTWTKRDSGIPTADGHTIAIALANSAPSTLYAKVEKGSDGTLLGVYKTTTGGETPAGGGDAWQTLAAGLVMNDSLWAGGGYSWYNSVLEVNPINANIVWGGGLNIFRTTNGGMRWDNVSSGADASYMLSVHADHHAVAFDPINPAIVYVGNDGGIDRTTDSSRATWSWRDVAHNMIITEFYRGAVQWAPASILAGGSQDNGTEITFGHRTWHNPGGCDGSDVAIDAESASTLYANCNGGLYELVNPVPGTPGGGTSASWTFPSGVNPISPVVTDPNLTGRALMAGVRPIADPPAPSPRTWDPRRLMKSVDGINWTSASDELPDDGVITTIAIAPSSSFQTYYVGIADTNPDVAPAVAPAIWRTTNGGGAWAKASTGLPAGQMPTSIAVDYANANRAFATFGGVGAVALTIDGGANWRTINGTGATALPSVPVTGITIDPTNATIIYIATSIGVFRGEVAGLSSTAPTAAWTPFNEGLPDGIDANGIFAIPDTGFLNIMTYGHGAYERDINPGTVCPTHFAHVRDNTFDRGYIPSPSNVPDPEWPIPDPARPPFYKPDDSDAGRLHWWTSPDIKVDVASNNPPANSLADVDHVEFDLCPARVSGCPAGSLIDSDPKRSQSGSVYVQVTNRGTETAHNVRVMAMWADATTGLPLLPNDFWATTFPVTAGAPCGVLDTSTGWRAVDPASPCRVISQLTNEQPEIVRFDWTVPATAAEHSCMLIVIESAEQPLASPIRATNERRLWELVPNSSLIALRNLHVVDSSVPGGSASGAGGMGVPNPTENKQPIRLTISRQTMLKDGRVIVVLPAEAQKANISENGGFRKVEFPKGKESAEVAEKYRLDPTLSFEALLDNATLELPVPPGKTWNIGLVYDSGPGKANTSERFSIIASQGDTVLGGSTYLLRHLPKSRFKK